MRIRGAYPAVKLDEARHLGHLFRMQLRMLLDHYRFSIINQPLHTADYGPFVRSQLASRNEL